MAIERSTVVGVFRNRTDAESAIEELHRIGFRDDHIGFAMRGEEGTTGSATDSGTQAPEGAATGIVTGGLIGGAIAAAALFIPGVGPVLAAGVLSTIIGGAAAGGAVGGLIGMLAGSGIPEDEARYYEGEFREGRALVTVNAGNRWDEVHDILHRFGAYDVEHREGAVASSTMPTGTTTPRTDTSVHEQNTVPLHEERLQAHTHPVQAGEVTVGKEVVTEHREMNVPVRREEVTIERHPVEARPPAAGEIREGEHLRVPVHEERVEVEKQPVVYEEVEVNKRPTMDTEHVTEEIRREEPTIERHGDVPVHMSGIRGWDEMSSDYRQRWQTRYGTQGGRWEDWEPSYRYGYEMANDPRFAGREWGQVEGDLQRDYGTWATSHGYHVEPNAWDRFKDSVRESWDSARDQRRAA